MKQLAAMLALLMASAPGCLVVGAVGGLTMTPIPDEYEGPIPEPFSGSEPPQLEPTRHAGLQKAASLGPDVYYDEPTELWYRYKFRRWYQAFRWNGNWFVLQETPQVLAGVETSPDKPLPTLPEYEEGPDAAP